MQNKEYKRILEIPEDEKVVSVIRYGGGYRWDFKYPFRHYVEPRYIIATEKSIYQMEVNSISDLSTSK